MQFTYAKCISAGNGFVSIRAFDFWVAVLMIATDTWAHVLHTRMNCHMVGKLFPSPCSLSNWISIFEYVVTPCTCILSFFFSFFFWCATNALVFVNFQKFILLGVLMTKKLILKDVQSFVFPSLLCKLCSLVVCKIQMWWITSIQLVSRVCTI